MWGWSFLKGKANGKPLLLLLLSFFLGHKATLPTRKPSSPLPTSCLLCGGSEGLRICWTPPRFDPNPGPELIEPHNCRLFWLDGLRQWEPFKMGVLFALVGTEKRESYFESKKCGHRLKTI